MGKGDKKSKRGKRWRNSYGVSRNRAALKAKLKRTASKKSAVKAEVAEAKPKKTTRKKAEA